MENRGTENYEERGYIDIHAVVEPRFQGIRLDCFLTERFHLSRSRAQKIIRTTLTINGNKPCKTGLKVNGGDKIHIRRPAPRDPPVPTDYQILQEDPHYVAISKPAGLPVHPTGNFLKNTLTSLLKKQYGTTPPPVLAHRLDRETSGVILVCRTKNAERVIKKAFEEGRVNKTYHAIVHGRITEPGTVNLPLGSDEESIIRIKQGVNPKGQPSVSHYRPVEQFAAYTLLEVKLETGRQHQIRAHMEAIGHPLVGDKIYGVPPQIFLKYIERGMTPSLASKLLLPYHALHASSLTFPHPEHGHPITVTAPLPDLLKEFSQNGSLRKTKNVS